LTHFAASIHDIAKSVNVLDRRLQPALKLRLPYAFGIMSILGPFDTVRSRASQLLKRFPLSSSSRGSFDAPADALIHVEVLPSSSSETYAILTISRIILIRVRKESHGAISASLCWEALFSKDTTISSRIDDHGHNSVALLVLMRDQEVKENHLPAEKSDVASPSSLDAGRGAQSLRSLWTGSPEAKISSSRSSNEFDHGTSKGAEGELQKWYSILAEYQYRRQLTRLHNAICCTTGAFDSVIHDPSLGHPNCTEGYTSFGMYFFGMKEVSKENQGFSDVLPCLDTLPWVSDRTFDETRHMVESEQKQYLQRSRVESSFATELKASKQEGGQEWLIFARATVLAEAYGPSDGPDGSNRRVSFADSSSFWTSREQSASDDARSMLAVSVPQFSSANLDNEVDVSEHLHSPTSMPDRDSRWLTNFDGDVAYPMLLEGSSSRQNEGENRRGKKSNQTAPSGESQSWHESIYSTQTFHTAETSEKRAQVRPRRKKRSSQQAWPLSIQNELLDLSSSSSSAPSFDRPGRATPSTVGAPCLDTPMQLDATTSQPSPAHNASNPHNDRMDRLEALMERMLIFSSEQALVQAQQKLHPVVSTPVAVRPDDDPASAIALLRQEIRDLRNLVLMMHVPDRRAEVTSPSSSASESGEERWHAIMNDLYAKVDSVETETIDSNRQDPAASSQPVITSDEMDNMREQSSSHFLEQLD
jgi:hypothetical protein